MKKSILFIGLALILALSVPVLAGPFADVPEGHWAYDAINKAYERGLMEGYPDGTFQGKRPITRYEMAMLIAKLIDKLDEIGVQIAKAREVPVKPGVEAEVKPTPPPIKGFTSEEEFNEFKATVSKLAAEFQDELAALGVKVSALEKGQKELEAKIADLGKVKISGSIRLRGWRNPEDWQDVIKKGENAGTFVDQWTVLNFSTTTEEGVSAKVSLWHRNWNAVSLKNVGAFPSVYSFPGWDKEADDTKLTVAEAYAKSDVTLLGQNGTISVGRQYFGLGPIGLLVKAGYVNVAPGAVVVNTDLNGVGLTGIAALLPGSDKYAAGRAAIKLGEDGELGVNVIPRGAGSVRESFGADVKVGPIVAEIASLKPAPDADRVTAVVVGADFEREKLSLNVKAADIDKDFNNSYSAMAWEDVEGVFRPGFKGFGVTGSLTLAEDLVARGEVCKGDSESPTGLAKASLTKKLSEGVDATVTVIQVGQEAASRTRIVRGELMIKF